MQAQRETSLEALATAKVRASQAYNEILYAPTKGLDEAALVAREIALAQAHRVLFRAAMALAEAI